MMLILISGVTALIMGSGGKMDSDTGARTSGGGVSAQAQKTLDIAIEDVYKCSVEVVSFECKCVYFCCTPCSLYSVQYSLIRSSIQLNYPRIKLPKIFAKFGRET